MKLQNKQKNLICGLFVITLVSVLSIFLANKTLPSAEGWYSYYAKCINNGDIVYKDFEYLFTPLYMYLIAIITNVFGYNVIVLRIFGIIIFAIIATVIYCMLNKVFLPEVAGIATVTGMFYLQSEVYSVFYDYVRVMDIFSYLSMLFMVCTILKHINAKDNKYIFFWGLFSSFFFLVKQNMGGLFLVYSILLITFLSILQKCTFKQWIIIEAKYIISFVIPVAFFVLIFWKLGLLDSMINSIFFNAVGAKGGLINILFRWIKNGWVSFARLLGLAIAYFLVIKINKKLSIWYKEEKDNFIYMITFFIITIVGLLVIFNKMDYGLYRAQLKRLDVTIIFLIDVVMICYYVIKFIIQYINKENIDINEVISLSLLGGYFALCYGAGMSGGLSIGESALGLALVIAIIFNSIKFKYGFLSKTLIIIYCINLIWNCTAYKLIYPCEWWGIDESNIYETTETTNIKNLSGIKLSEETRNVYEKIIGIIENNSNKDEAIYCFPDCPILYVLSERNDPGVYAKVQWFDVSANDSVKNDIKILEDNLPKVIVIHNLYDATYEGHESAFNYGQLSGTHMMRDFLYQIVNSESYQYSGTYISGKDNFSVYVYRDNIDLNEIFKKGKGTKEKPYQIETVDELVNFEMLVNQGYDFDGVYFEQIAEIDCKDVVWVPLGYYNDFNGNYETNEYKIININNSYFNSGMEFGTKFYY